jgi:hypothetical protein
LREALDDNNGALNKPDIIEICEELEADEFILKEEIDRTIMPPFYKSVAILSSGLTSWKMEPFPINSPTL